MTWAARRRDAVYAEVASPRQDRHFGPGPGIPLTQVKNLHTWTLSLPVLGRLHPRCFLRGHDMTFWHAIAERHDGYRGHVRWCTRGDFICLAPSTFTGLIDLTEHWDGRA